MNFVAYFHIFICICIIYDVISMNLDVFGDFPKSPLYFGYNSVGQETPVLCIISFQGPIRTQIDGGFFVDYYFLKYDELSFGITQTEPGRKRWPWWRAPPPGRATQAIFCLEPPQPSIKSSKRFS